MKILCLITNTYISERELRKTRHKQFNMLLAEKPERWDEKTQERGKFRVEK